MLVEAAGIPTTVHAAFNFASVLTPPLALGAAEVDYTPMGLDTASVLRLTAHTAGSTLSGLLAPTLGQLLLVLNISTPTADYITLLSQAASSLAPNRFIVPAAFAYDVNGDDRSTFSRTIVPGGHAWIWYDLATARWRVL